MFIVEQNVVEVYRFNQKLTELSPPYEISCVAASEEYVAFGTEVSLFIFLLNSCVKYKFLWFVIGQQRLSIHMGW